MTAVRVCKRPPGTVAVAAGHGAAGTLCGALMRRARRRSLRCTLFIAGCTNPTPQSDRDVALDTSRLEIWPRAVVGDGQSQALVVLHVRDGAGAPVPNVRAMLAVEVAPRQGMACAT